MSKQLKWREVELEVKLAPRGEESSEKDFTGKTVRVHGEAIGHLAVTPYFDGINLSDTRYCITHVPTTGKFPQSYSKRDARKIARDLHHLNWDFSRIADCPPETKKACFDYLVARDLR